MAAKTYDPKVYALAEQFIEDDLIEANNNRQRCHDLACAIQEAIEHWFFEEGAQPMSKDELEKLIVGHQ